MDTNASMRPVRDRDFLGELQRQRDEAAAGGAYPNPVPFDNAAAVLAVPRVERSVGESAPAKRSTTYDADDLEIPSFLRRK